MGNHWVLIRFANAQDRVLVYDKRPFFINGLNFVLKPWVVFFDPMPLRLLRWISESASLDFRGVLGG